MTRVSVLALVLGLTFAVSAVVAADVATIVRGLEFDNAQDAVLKT